MIAILTRQNGRMLQVFTAALRSRSTFNSEHTGIMNICLADGSVKPVDKNIEFGVLLRLGGMCDELKGQF